MLRATLYQQYQAFETLGVGDAAGVELLLCRRSPAPQLRLQRGSPGGLGAIDGLQIVQQPVVLRGANCVVGVG